MAKLRVALLHWHAEEIGHLARHIRQYHVEPVVPQPGESLKVLEGLVPAAIVISLDRLPSHGREVGMHLRERKATRTVPIVFAGGAPEKVEKVRAALPDAGFANWDNVDQAIACALEAPPPVMKKAARERGNPLPVKLGLKPGLRIVILGAPQPFEQIVRDLPEDLLIEEEQTPRADAVFWFVRRESELEAGIHWLHLAMPRAKLWLLWERGQGRKQNAVSYRTLVEVAAADGYAQYKIVQVDSVWSAMAFGKMRQG